jgi:hypothetical protein
MLESSGDPDELLAYFKNVTPTFQCLDNLKEVTGFVTPVRVGGTTQ